MFDRIAPTYDRMNRLMTFGLDKGWRRRAVGELGLSRGSLVLDLACGTGDLCKLLRCEGMRAVGVDISAGMLAAAGEGLALVEGDCLALPAADATFDGVTSGFALRNVADVKAFLRELGRVVRPGGRVAIIEVDAPSRPAARAVHGIWFRRVVPQLGRLVGEHDAYSYLPRSTAYLPSFEELSVAMQKAGLSEVRKVVLAAGAAQLLTATRNWAPAD